MYRRGLQLALTKEGTVPFPSATNSNHCHPEPACAKQAQTAFPDFSADANAKREARLKDCLNANNLPPREPAAPAH